MNAKKTIRRLPACTDWKGNHYPKRWGVTVTDNLGNRWDGGEYATREEAVAARVFGAKPTEPHRDIFGCISKYQ